ncbi:MAG: hypothetical protein ACE5K0_04240 [Candidatus Methanofastidiosia archaeon]
MRTALRIQKIVVDRPKNKLVLKKLLEHKDGLYFNRLFKELGSGSKSSLSGSLIELVRAGILSNPIQEKEIKGKKKIVRNYKIAEKAKSYIEYLDEEGFLD